MFTNSFRNDLFLYVSLCKIMYKTTSVQHYNSICAIVELFGALGVAGDDCKFARVSTCLTKSYREL